MEGTLFIAADVGRAVELYGDNKNTGEEGGKSSFHEDVSLSLERGFHELSMWARENDEPGSRR